MSVIRRAFCELQNQGNQTYILAKLCTTTVQLLVLAIWLLLFHSGVLVAV